MDISLKAIPGVHNPKHSRKSPCRSEPGVRPELLPWGFPFPGDFQPAMGAECGSSWPKSRLQSVSLCLVIAAISGFIRVTSCSHFQTQDPALTPQARSIAELCASEEFAKVRVKVHGECAASIRAMLSACGAPAPACTDSESQNSLSSFKREAGEHVVYVRDPDGKSTYAVLDLRQIVERYTGYAEGCVIWNAAYQVVRGNPLLAQILSGIHCSVTVHLAAFYTDDPTSSRLVMNHGLMQQKVKHDHLYNMHAAFHFLQSLLPVALPDIERIAVSARAKRAVAELTQYAQSIPQDIQSLNLQRGSEEQTRILSELMSCVSCIRCRVWGRVQMEGLKGAVLLARKMQGSSGISVSREDVICYVNLLNRISVAISQYGAFLDQIQGKNRTPHQHLRQQTHPHPAPEKCSACSI